MARVIDIPIRSTDTIATTAIERKLSVYIIATRQLFWPTKYNKSGNGEKLHRCMWKGTTADGVALGSLYQPLSYFKGHVRLGFLTAVVDLVVLIAENSQSHMRVLGPGFRCLIYLGIVEESLGITGSYSKFLYLSLHIYSGIVINRLEHCHHFEHLLLRFRQLSEVLALCITMCL
jgi:hypothetical protein